MAFTPCGSLLSSLTQQLETSEGQALAHDYVSDKINKETFLSCIGAMLPEPDAAVLKDEMREFPSDVLDLVLKSWAVADVAGHSFRLLSRVPDRPLDLARRQAVRLTIELDRSGVTFAVEHIPGRHAAWLSRGRVDLPIAV